MSIQKTLCTIIAVAAIGFSGCNNNQPIPKNPITYTGIPREVVEVEDVWKMGTFTEGFRIKFDDYYAITDSQGLFGQEGWQIGGIGAVPHGIVESFRKIADLCRLIKNKEEISIYGDLAKTKEKKDYLFNGEKVIFLYNATYKDQSMEVDRRPWNN